MSSFGLLANIRLFLKEICEAKFRFFGRNCQPFKSPAKKFWRKDFPQHFKP